MGGLYGAGGPSSSLQAWLSLQHRWGNHFGIALDLSAPLSLGSLSGPEGHADVGAILVGGEVLLRLPSEKERFAFTSGLGVALASLISKGHPSSEGTKQLFSSSATAYTGAGYLRAEAEWRPVAWLGLGAMGLLGTTLVPMKIRFAGNDAGTWGVPFLGALLFAQAHWH